MYADLETFTIAVYVKVDDELKTRPDLHRYSPPGGIPPRLAEAELVTMAVMQALLGFHSERRRVPNMRKHFAGMFPYQLTQSGDNKRLRAALPSITPCGLHRKTVATKNRVATFALLLRDEE